MMILVTLEMLAETWNVHKHERTVLVRTSETVFDLVVSSELAIIKLS